MRTFTKEEYEDLRARDVFAFKEFLMNKFFQYTSRHRVMAGKNHSEDTVKVKVPEVLKQTDSGGWGGWAVRDVALFDDEINYFVIYHFMNDERLPVSYDSFVKMPKEFVFGEEDPEYLEYLRLEAKYGKREES